MHFSFLCHGEQRASRGSDVEQTLKDNPKTLPSQPAGSDLSAQWTRSAAESHQDIRLVIQARRRVTTAGGLAGTSRLCGSRKARSSIDKIIATTTYHGAQRCPNMVSMSTARMNMKSNARPARVSALPNTWRYSPPSSRPVFFL